MAYIPPHKRHLKDAEKPAPEPSELLPLHSRRVSDSRSTPERRKERGSWRPGVKIVYAEQSISRWFIAPLTDVDGGDDRIPYPVHLEPISCESVERRSGEKPMIIVGDHLRREDTENCSGFAKSPPMLIMEKIQSDLVASFQNVRDDMFSNELEEVKPSFIARFGKVFFHGSPSVSLDTIDKSSAVETALCQVKRSFYTNISDSYMEAILGGAIPKLGVVNDEEKEYYHVKVFDKSRPNATISCKCSVIEDVGELELCKIAVNEVRHLVADISCLDKNLDLRLMLCTKRILTTLTVDEKDCLNSLIKSAIIDPDVKGGLRWTLGKESLGDRYSVISAWHTKSRSFKNSLMRLKLRHADRFDFRTTTGEATKEVNLRMRGITKQLRDQILELDLMTDMVLDNLKLIWDHFLCHECTFS